MRTLIVGGGSAVVAIVLIVGLSVGLSLPKKSSSSKFRDIFMERCEQFKTMSFCENIFTVFEKAYNGKSHCEVYESDYNNFMNQVHFDHPQDKMMLWSKTDELVHEYTRQLHKNNDCFTLEDTWLGSTLNGLKWCGQKGSNETYTSDCPGCKGCKNSPVRSFWRSISGKFADYARGNVTVMLHGSQENPFDSESTFASVELKRLRYPTVKHLIVILVTGQKSNCQSKNLQTLRDTMNSRIGFTCKEVPESRIKECASYKNMGCGACLLKKTN